MAIEILTKSTLETEKLGEELAKYLPYGSVVATFGEVGAGKTAFTRGFCKGLNIDSDVSSPTFSLVNEYHNKNRRLIHFDMYRISGFDDLYSTGYFDYLAKGDSMVIEWCENIEPYLENNFIKIYISKTQEENERIFEIYGCDKFEFTGN